ncbi:cyclase family protein [Algoriphagus marinus]|uniref:cyclase family protein n=1 Tax=Algoriphagus marinus TaxID=1925762 RepID=UPI00094B811E|nr:cyclase family protein [Algoriphagus marinus]
MKNTFILIASLIFLASCNQQPIEKYLISLEELEWVDLTHSFDSSTLYWPNNPTDFEHDTDAYGTTDLGYFYSSYSLSTPEHGGTHLDAPIHFSEGKLTSDQIPLSSLIGKAIVIDVSEKALKDRDYLISEEDVKQWESTHGQIDPNQIVLFKTGYGKFYPDRESYFGTAKKGDEAIPELHFPGISAACATWLVSERKIKAIGLDTPSLDYGQSKAFEAHQVFMGANIPGFENVANLENLPAKDFYIMALPMKIKDGSGGPLRIIAGLPSK